MPRKKDQTGATLSVEARLVLASIANPQSVDSRSRARALAAGKPDWDELRRIANWHGVMPLVYRFFADHAPDAMPARAMAAWRADYTANALRNLRLARELVRVVSAFQRQGIASIALKGPALAVATYRNLALRQFTDLDLLIHERDLPRAADLLSEAGYLPRRYERDRPGGGFFRGSEDEFASADGSDLIDVHWRLVPGYFPFAPDGDALWSRAIRVAIEGAEIATLAPADAMLFLVAHATKHGWPVMRPICDIAALAAQERFDWDSVAAEAERLQCTRMLLLGATLAAELAGVAIPARILSAARADPRVIRLALRVESRMFAATGVRAGLFSEWLVPLAAIEGVGRRVRYCADRGLRPTIDDWEFLRLPPPLYPLYWALRPIRLAIDHGPRLLMRTRAPQSTIAADK
ncbi:MAG: nucleotidyltransferase family protein [Candidatus Binataceae bacterium]